MSSWRWFISFIVLLMASGCSSPSPREPVTAQRLGYSEIVSRLEEFDRGTILYVDPNLVTAVQISPDRMIRMACRVEIRKNFPQWKELTAVLREESPTATSHQVEVRAGVLLQHPQYGTQEILVTQFDRRSPPGGRYFGYVNGEQVYFTERLPAKLVQLVSDSKSCPTTRPS